MSIEQVDSQSPLSQSMPHFSKDIREKLRKFKDYTPINPQLSDATSATNRCSSKMRHLETKDDGLFAQAEKEETHQDNKYAVRKRIWIDLDFNAVQPIPAPK